MTTTTTSPSTEMDLVVTQDAFLGDRLRMLQPAKGYRAGVDAVLLAATVSEASGAPIDVLDCGAGVGTVGLCIAARCANARVTLVERETDLLSLAQRNITENALAARVTAVEGDLMAPASDPAAPRLPKESFDIVVANPPFHIDGKGTPACNALKKSAHAMQSGGLDAWVRFAARMARPGGRLTVIHKAEALPDLLEAMSGRFGALSLTPVQAYATGPAIRVLITGTKGSRAPLSIEAPFILHAQGGAFTPHAGRILREGAALELFSRTDE